MAGKAIPGQDRQHVALITNLPARGPLVDMGIREASACQCSQQKEQTCNRVSPCSRPQRTGTSKSMLASRRLAIFHGRIARNKDHAPRLTRIERGV
jgi:hypothetical protein